MMRLELMGSVALRDGDAILSGRAVQRARLALLALLAAAGDRGLSRDKLVGYLWPEKDPETARRRLSDSLYVLRRELGEDVVATSGDVVALNPDVVDSDLAAFGRAVEAGDAERLLQLYAGPFMDGFFLRGSNEFESWIDQQREASARDFHRVMASAAATATASGEVETAAKYRRAVADHQPYDSRAALALMRALDDAGDRPGAILHARAHADALDRDLGLAPDPEVETLSGRLNEAPTGDGSSERPAAPASVPASAPRRGTRPPAPAAPTGPGRPAFAAAPDTHRQSPFRRIVPWLAVVAGLGLIVVLARSVTRFGDAAGPAPGANTVVVFPFADGSGRGGADIAGSITGDWLTRGLIDTWLVDVIDGRLELGASGRPRPASLDEARLLGTALGAGTAVWGTYEKSGDDLGLSAYLVDTGSGTVWDSVIVPPSADRIAQAERVRGGVVRALAGRFDSRFAAWGDESASLPSYVAYGLLITAQDERWSTGAGPVIPLLEQAAAVDTSFQAVRPYLAMAYADAGRIDQAERMVGAVEERAERMSPIDRARMQGVVGVMRGDPAGVLSSARRLTTLAPRSPYFARRAARAALDQRRPHEAIELLDASQATGGDFDPAGFTFLRARAQHGIGDHGAELAIVRRGRLRHPGSVDLLASEIRARAALGQGDSVSLLVREAFADGVGPAAFHAALVAGRELEAHGRAADARAILDTAATAAWPGLETASAEARLTRAWLAYYARRFDRAATLFGSIRAADGGTAPEAIREADAGLALVAAWTGAGKPVDTTTRPAASREIDGSAHYLAARIAAVRGDGVAAARELQTALRQGFSPPGDGLLGPHNETDFLRSGAGAPLRSLVSDMYSGD